MEALFAPLSEACCRLFAISPGLALMAIPVLDAHVRKRADEAKEERREKACRRVKRALEMG